MQSPFQPRRLPQGEAPMLATSNQIRSATARFGERMLGLRGPDGLRVEPVAEAGLDGGGDRRRGRPRPVRRAS